MAVLLQESLAQIGIKTTINKIPGANWRSMLLKKEMPLFINAFGGWLNYPEYFFFWNYHGQNAVFNTMSYQNPEMDKLIDAARFETRSEEVRGRRCAASPKIAIADVPRVPIYQPQPRRGDAEERHGLPVLVPPPARLPPARQGVSQARAHRCRLVGRRLLAAAARPRRA